MVRSVFSTLRDTVMSSHTVGGYQQAPGDRFIVDNAVTFARRTAQSFLGTTYMNPGNALPAELKSASDTLMCDIMESWRKVAPGSEGGGAYLNEADITTTRYEYLQF
jgi:hypothetical protein